MGFLQEIKIFLSTNNADSLDDNASGAIWNLGTRLTNINPLYRIKLKCTKVHIPDTFTRISKELQNDTLTLVWNDTRALPTYNLRDKQTLINNINAGNIVHLTVSDANKVDSFDMLAELNQKIRIVMKNKGTRRIPQFLTGTPTTSIHVKVLSIRTDIAPDKSIAIRIPGYPFNPTTEQPVSIEDHIPDWTVPIEPVPDPSKPVPILPKIQNYLFMSRYDIHKTNVTPDQVGLLRILGFDRTRPGPYSTPYDNGPKVFPEEKHDADDGLGNYVAAPSQMDLAGIRFISVALPDIGITNIDAATKSFGRVITCIPVLATNGDSPIVDSGNQDNPYMTIPQDTINSFQIKLVTDIGTPLRVNHDWFIEFNMRIEEPEKIDTYNGTKDIPNIPDFGRDGYDEGMYEKANLEVNRWMNSVDIDEARERERFVRRHRR